MARKWSELLDKLIARGGREWIGDMVVYPRDPRDVACAECAEPLMVAGEMQSTAFMVPENPNVDPILCESCARRAGVWED